MSIIFNQQANHHLSAKMFLDDGGNVGVQRYDEVKYDSFENFTDKQHAFFWRPTEVDLSTDKNDFKDLPNEQKHIFTSNLFRQIVLDSVQGRGPNLAFLPIATVPELENWIENWAMNETIHSRSYTHIIRNIYPDPAAVIDQVNQVPEIMECASSISKYYDELVRHNIMWQAKQFGMKIEGETYDEYEHKKALWMAINSVNALEGLRFYVSFACSWNFAELKKMEGNAKIIKLICRDENLHLGSTQFMLRTLPRDDKLFEQIKEDTKVDVYDMFFDVMKQEKAWAKYLFKDGSMIGLSEEILSDYVSFIAAKRMRTVGLDVDFSYPGSDPLPWTKNWISGKTVQVAPQEAEISSYLVSDVKQDVDADVLSGLSL